jgi:hypothetical protein
MARFILRYRGAGTEPATDLERIRTLPNVVVLEVTSRMLLVEAPEAELPELTHALQDWVVAPEQMTPLPDTRKKVRKSKSR